MPLVDIHVGRIDFGECSGMIYSFDPIKTGEITVGDMPGTIRLVTAMKIQTPQGYVLEKVTTPNPFGDTEQTRMVYCPEESEKSTSGGRVYIRAARIVEKMHSPTSVFRRVD